MHGRERNSGAVNFKNKSKERLQYVTTNPLATVEVITAIETIGKNGPALLQDSAFLQHISSFDRERIPERVVHAKGAGAFGYFEVTHDISKYSAAKIFDTIGKRTPIAVRFSRVISEHGSTDAVRDIRGFAIKFYTDDGNWDLVGNNTPIFFIRDPALFPSFIHSQKMNPANNLTNADMTWDFLTLRPESVHQVMMLFSDRGIPDGFRHMNGYGCNTFKLVDATGRSHWVKFHYKTNQGITNLSVDRAEELRATDSDYFSRDLYNNIKKGDYPSWTLYIQVMTLAEAEHCEFNPFDVTKIWPSSKYPLIPVGNLILHKNPKNYFAEVEQLAFCPSNLVPGIEPSPDKVLQGRMFSYNDTQYHRLGRNFRQLPVNCPFQIIINNQRDGLQAEKNEGTGSPNYFPNSFSYPQVHPKEEGNSRSYVSGEIGRYDSGDEDNFSQATVFYKRVLDDGAKQRLVANLVNSLKNTSDFIQERAIKMFSIVHPDLGRNISVGLVPYKKYHANL